MVPIAGGDVENSKDPNGKLSRKNVRVLRTTLLHLQL